MAVCGYSLTAEARILLVANDPESACRLSRDAGYACECVEVLLTDLENQPGSFCRALWKIADAEVDLDYCYMTRYGPGEALAVIRTGDNIVALNALQV